MNNYNCCSHTVRIQLIVGTVTFWQDTLTCWQEKGCLFSPHWPDTWWSPHRQVWVFLLHLTQKLSLTLFLNSAYARVILKSSSGSNYLFTSSWISLMIFNLLYRYFAFHESFPNIPTQNHLTFLQTVSLSPFPLF